MKPLVAPLAVALGLLVCWAWFRLTSQRERVPMGLGRRPDDPTVITATVNWTEDGPRKVAILGWVHPFAEDWNDPGMDAYDEPQPADPWPSSLTCSHPDSWFDRTICAVDGWMHTCCTECGRPLDGPCASAAPWGET
jgi:hypothetical protein